MIQRQPLAPWRALQRLFVVVLPLIVILIGSTLALAELPQPINTLALAQQTASPGAGPALTTAPRADASALQQQRAPIGATFSTYYANHNGAAWLGDALTPEIPASEGIEQVFQGGMLRASISGSGQISTVPLVSALVNAGALQPLGATETGLTYAWLAGAARPTQLVTAPWWWHAGSRAVLSGIFVAEGSRYSSSVGHYIPVAFATYLTKLGNWQSIVGIPLTEALPVLSTIQGVPHHLVLQAYDRAILFDDQTADQATPQHTPTITTQPVGADYLAIFGVPGSKATTVTAWTATPPVAVQVGPGMSLTEGTFTSQFPVTLLGDSIWLSGVLWEHVQWQNLGATRDGWVQQTQLGHVPATDVPQTADLGVLSPALAVVAAKQQQTLAVSVYVPDYNRTYSYNASTAIVMGSTFKIPILLTLLKQAESQSRPLTANEETLATAMIENSDNDAAAAIYSEIGYDTGVNAFLQSAGIVGITIDQTAFGYSTTTPVAMTQLLNALWDGHVVNESDRQYVLDLMGHVEADQQMGLGTAAPPNATVAMKDGWLDDVNGWVNDSVGIITANGHTYLVAVYANAHDTFDDGWIPVNTICSGIVDALR